MLETFGLSNPVPITINAIEIYKPNSAIGKAKTMCPIIIRTPPKKTVLLAPQILSASQPPATVERKTSEP